MEELIQQAAATLGWPAAMVERSARARANAEGVAVEAVLSAWAGGGEIATAPAAAAPAAAEDTAPVPAAPAAPAPAAPPEAEVAAPQVEVIGGPEDAAEVAADEAEAHTEAADEVEERRPVGVPAWLAATFVLIPAVAFFYAVFFPNGPDCGVGPQLAVDPVTGEAVNCDGSAFGTEGGNVFALGEELYVGRCAACHGDQGQGGGNFPALSGGAVLATFGSCSDHVEWVDLGTVAWPDATYGDNATPVGASGAAMPGFAGVLTEEEIQSVVLYERVAFGGEELAVAQEGCFAEAEAEGEEEAPAAAGP